MAYSLSSERPDVAASSATNPLRAIGAWIARQRAKRAQRVALASLLDFDEALLADLGVTRDDVITAMQYPTARAGDALSARRARASRDWLSHP